MQSAPDEAGELARTIERSYPGVPMWKAPLRIREAQSTLRGIWNRTEVFYHEAGLLPVKR